MLMMKRGTRTEVIDLRYKFVLGQLVLNRALAVLLDYESRQISERKGRKRYARSKPSISRPRPISAPLKSFPSACACFFSFQIPVANRCSVSETSNISCNVRKGIDSPARRSTFRGNILSKMGSSGRNLKSFALIGLYTLGQTDGRR